MLTNFLSKNNGVDTQQYSLHDGAAIFADIRAKLLDAKDSIRVAATWFTDNDLFQVLQSRKIQTPVLKIEIVLDNNKENYWLPFMELVKMGCTVRLSEGIGSNGRMHQKFCIIDDRILINGTYNWSKNARTENHENVIVSSVQSTVGEFKNQFQTLLEHSKEYLIEPLVQPEASVEEPAKVVDEREVFKNEFKKVLDEMIYSSVLEYDKENLANKGLERSQKCAGDSNIISNELDTVYTEMMNSISASERKKEIIHAKVATHLQESTSALKEKLGRQRELIEVETENTINGINGKIVSIKETNHILKEEILTLEKQDIINNNNKIAELTEERNIKEGETIKMPFRWHIEIPTYVGLLGLLAYIILFYSSAAYILLFAEQEAKSRQLLGQPIDKIGIYYPDALANAAEVGISELLLILLVPFFLVTGIIYIRKLKTRIPKGVIKIVSIILIDGLTAIAVTKSIHESNYLAGIETEHFKMRNIFSDMNFYLIFIFGMLSLLIFDLTLSYILGNFKNRNDVHVKAKKQAEIKLLNEEISLLKKNNVELQGLVAKKKETIEHNLQIISSLEKEIGDLPTAKRRKINLLENETASQVLNLENIVKIATNKIDNELFNFSTHFIRDRINVFLRGWNDFIFSYYSNSIAESKAQEANRISSNWFETHFSKTQLSTI
jgi:hypothetical protein